MYYVLYCSKTRAPHGRKAMWSSESPLVKVRYQNGSDDLFSNRESQRRADNDSRGPIARDYRGEGTWDVNKAVQPDSLTETETEDSRLRATKT